MKHILRHLSVTCALVPTLVSGGPFDGVYKQTANAECSLVGIDGGSVKVEDSIFYGVEMQCRMINPIDIRDMNATIFNMECSGSGQTWSERAIMMADAETPGVYMIWNGYAFRYQRCDVESD